MKIELPINEPVRDYAMGDPGVTSLKRELEYQSNLKIEIPCIVNGEEIYTGNTIDVVMPCEHGKVLATAHLATSKELSAAAESAVAAQRSWNDFSWTDRVSIFRKSAELLAGPYRDRINAATMLGQGKNAYQAEIDSACELIDFLRFNGYFYQEIMKQQPESSPGVLNRLEYRPLEGFVFAITPFNFTAIAGNLPTAPAMMGNVSIWKPSSTQLLSAYYTMKVFEESGLPKGVINFLPSSGAAAGAALLGHENFAGVHFTGSTQTFRHIYKTIGNSIDRYKSYPRIVGETGGKDFIFAHETADIDALRTAMVRGAFEYQGQKCSAASRAYIPKSLWKKLKPSLIAEVKEIKMGDVRDFSNFVNAVIDKKAFEKIKTYLEFASASPDADVIVGGEVDDSTGNFIRPTIIETGNPEFKTMVEEIFGPVLTVYPYEDGDVKKAAGLCADGSDYALTGAIFANDRNAIVELSKAFEFSAGNFYINDKPTGAVVGQQPFGGGRASGTNDKAGSHLNLLRWLSPRTVKETFVPAKNYRYPFLKS